MSRSSLLLGLALSLAWAGGAVAASAAGQGQADAAGGYWIPQRESGVCKLVRLEGRPLRPVMRLEIIPGSQTAELWLINSRLRLPPRRDYAGLSIRTEPDGALHSNVYGRGYDWQGSKYFLLYLPPEMSLETLASANSLRLERSGRRLLDIPIPSLERALPAVRHCMSEVLRDWGFDPDAYNALLQPPRSIGRIADWVNSRDYPTQALLDGRGGRSIVRVTVGADGRARDCSTVVSSGDVALDRTTCAIADRGRFEPALDRDGRPTEAPYIYSVSWRFQG